MTHTSLPHLDVSIEAGAWADPERMADLCRKAVDATCSLAGLDMHPQAEAGVILSDDAHIRSLNSDHRNKDKATNVLSFPICDANAAVKGPLLGDIVLAYETVESEAIEQEKPLDEHFSHLIIHGFLHLFGYDHQIENDANEMEALEIAVMLHLGYSNPYAGAPV